MVRKNINSAVVDNDIILKLLVYDLHREITQSKPFGVHSWQILASAKYVILSILEKSNHSHHKKKLLADSFRSCFLPTLQVIEPSSREIEYAAKIELIASDLNLELDIGESLLYAIALSQEKDFLITGDKRAIRSFESMLEMSELDEIKGKFLCLEQLLLEYLNNENFRETRNKICGEKRCDLAVSSCFSCSSDVVELKNCCDGLSSYIDHIKRDAARLMFHED